MDGTVVDRTVARGADPHPERRRSEPKRQRRPARPSAPERPADDALPPPRHPGRLDVIA
ncbi:MAG TPA: hypothetical protein VMS22_17805 [Candidatus Eisenbacteria bacterium]|nr:hypothetical protein [Candidatus Eisenbacteria bacterium]